MNAKFTEHSHNRVSVSYDYTLTGNRETMRFRAPVNGGYVRFDNEYNGQVCDALLERGNTLRWGGNTPLIDLIRSEFRAYRRVMERY